MRIADTHCDTLSFFVKEGVNAWHRERTQNNAPHVNAKAAETGGLALQVMALFIAPVERGGDPATQYADLLRAYRAWLHAEPDIVNATPDTIAVIWQQGKLGTILSIEGGECLEDDPSRVQLVYDDGVRGIGLCWNGQNGLASGISGDGGLTDVGRAVMGEMERLHMWVDASHLNVRSFWDVARAATRPIMASHSNCHALRQFARNLADDQIRLLIEQKGYMGINLLPFFLADPVPNEPETNHQVTLAHVIAHMRHVLDLGGEEILGLGADLDGVGTLPHCFVGAESYPLLVEAMREAGFGEALAEKIAYHNWLRYWTDITR